MPKLFWDASALGKRYAVENGSATVNALWTSGAEMTATLWGYAEVYAILVRRLNSGRIDRVTFAVQAAALQNEVLNDPSFALLTVDDVAVLNGLSFIRAHSLNTTDAAILSVFLDFQKSFSSQTDNRIVLVSSDERLVRAANAEGVTTINPERASPTDLQVILNRL